MNNQWADTNYIVLAVMLMVTVLYHLIVVMTEPERREIDTSGITSQNISLKKKTMAGGSVDRNSMWYNRVPNLWTRNGFI